MWNAAKLMPISLSSSIISTNPIWLAVIAHFYLGEEITKFDILAIFTSFSGVLIINNSSFQNDETQDVKYPDEIQYSPNEILKGTIFSVIGAFGFAAAGICKRIMRKNIHYSISPFWFASACTLFSPLAHFYQ